MFFNLRTGIRPLAVHLLCSYRPCFIVHSLLLHTYMKQGRSTCLIRVESSKQTVWYYSFIYTVPLNYNFILTRVSTSGATKYFTCQMPEFPVEIQISTRRDVAFRRGVYRDTRRGTWHFTRDGIVTFTRDVVVLTKLNNWQDSICL